MLNCVWPSSVVGYAAMQEINATCRSSRNNNFFFFLLHGIIDDKNNNQQKRVEKQGKTEVLWEKNWFQLRRPHEELLATIVELNIFEKTVRSFYVLIEFLRKNSRWINSSSSSETNLRNDVFDLFFFFSLNTELILIMEYYRKNEKKRREL